MRRVILPFLVIAVIILTVRAGDLSAQDGEESQYVGAAPCVGCHSDVGQLHAASRHAMALQKTDKDKAPILARFDQDADVRTVRFPGEDSPRPFTADDIAFAIGSGRYVQQYLYEVAPNEYAVFPARWNVIEQQWQPAQRAEDWPDPAYDWNQNCAFCHVTGLNVEEGKWNDAGVQCEACHGPGSLHIQRIGQASHPPTDEDLVSIREPVAPSMDAEVCGQCHSRGVAPDEHPYPVEYLPRHELLDDTVFSLAPATNSAYWWPTGHARQTYMQFNEWLTAGHSNSLNVLKSSDKAKDACLQCHSSDYRQNQTLIESVVSGERQGSAPDPLTLDTAQFGVTCVSCHTVHMNPENLGTGNNPALLLAQDPYALCVQCHHDNDVTPGLHHPMQEMYEGHTVINEVPGIPSAHFATERGPNCVTCHTPVVPTDGVSRFSHVFRPVMPGAAMNVEDLKSTCATCHGDQVDNAKLQELIDDIQASTRTRIDRARAGLTVGTASWVGTALDFIEGDGSMGVHNYTYTDELLDRVETELGLDLIVPAAEAIDSASSQ